MKTERKTKTARPARAQLDKLDLGTTRFAYVPEYATLYLHVSARMSLTETLLAEAQLNRPEMVKLRDFLNEHIGDAAPGAVTAEEFETLEALEQKHIAQKAAAADAPPPLTVDEQHKLLAIATMRDDRSVRTLVSEGDTMEADLAKRGYLTTKHGKYGTVWALTPLGRASVAKPAVSQR